MNNYKVKYLNNLLRIYAQLNQQFSNLNFTTFLKFTYQSILEI